MIWEILMMIHCGYLRKLRMNSAISTGLFGILGGLTGWQSTGLGCSAILCACLECQNGRCSRHDISYGYAYVSVALKMQFDAMEFVNVQYAVIFICDQKHHTFDESAYLIGIIMSSPVKMEFRCLQNSLSIIPHG